MARARDLKPALATLGLLLFVGTVAWLVRSAHDARVRLPGEPHAFSAEPDSLYHMRRVLRTFQEGLPPAERDPLLNAPSGAEIPWPPYYTWALLAALRPTAPETGTTAAPQALREHIEGGVLLATRPLGVATALLAALLGGLLAGRAGALFAGTYQACCLAAVLYSRPGNGDHHAWVSLLAGLLLLTLCRALARGALNDRRRALRYGLLIGSVAGLALGSWVGSLLHILQLQLVFGVLLFVHARRPLHGLAAMGLAFHLAALITVLPAVLTSPWRAEHPWLVVNLSWFHVAQLSIGALVFVPLLGSGGERRRRGHPWRVALALSLLAGVVSLLPFGPGPGISEGFAWVSRAETFMSGIAESRPLIGPGVTSRSEVFVLLGVGVALLPVAWIAALRRVLARGDHPLLPLVVAAPPLAIQAASQARFAEALVLPLAALLGTAWVLALGRMGRVGTRLAPWLAVPAAALLTLPGASQTVERWRAPEAPPITIRRDRALRRSLTWLAETPVRGSVLADWSHGHAIEWITERPTVATNFGSYVGEEGFRAPARLFLEEDPAAAEALLVAHEVRHVLVTSRHVEIVPSLLDTTSPERRARFLEPSGSGGLHVRPPWFRTVGATLVCAGEGPRDPRGSLGFLRCVHACPISDPSPPLAAQGDQVPYVLIYERVAGAWLVGRAAAGEDLVVECEVAFPGTPWTLRFRATARADASGLARLRVPYPSTQLLGDMRWSLGAAAGTVQVLEADVLAGQEITLPQ